MNARIYHVPKQTALKGRHWALGLILPFLCFYFAFYLFFGPRGLVAWHKTQDDLRLTEQSHEELKKKRHQLESDVTLMRPTSLDPDMADEQARRTLGYMKPEDVVIDLP